jgi:hypothetical protein
VGVLSNYGLIKSSDVTVNVGGAQESLSIAAYHPWGDRTFTVDSEGAISW